LICLLTAPSSPAQHRADWPAATIGLLRPDNCEARIGSCSRLANSSGSTARYRFAARCSAQARRGGSATSTIRAERKGRGRCAHQWSSERGARSSARCASSRSRLRCVPPRRAAGQVSVDVGARGTARLRGLTVSSRRDLEAEITVPRSSAGGRRRCALSRVRMSITEAGSAPAEALDEARMVSVRAATEYMWCVRAGHARTATGYVEHVDGRVSTW